MRKKIALIVTLVICTMGMAACGDKKDDDKKETKTESTAAVQEDFSVSELADKLKAEGSFTDLSPLESKIAVERLYGLDSSKIEDSAFYSNSNATAEDVAVIKVNDESYVADVKKAIEDRVAEQTKSFESYNAAEVPKLEDAVIITSGKYVVFVVSGDSAKAKDIIKGYIK
ncbi:MAG: DUF4358 domain-containing protein [Eubacterium sp.]|nr:DUF4358 domain-containing protein [Eubacterium sp.]